jgi:hypothetical protein
MKQLNTRIISTLVLGGSLLAGTAFAQSSFRSADAITPPAVNNGSNFSRAPFLASRQYDPIEMKKVTTIETVSTEPVLSMTGRPSVAHPVIYPARTTSTWDNRRVMAPAVHDGSNFSRAPIPAARQFDDVKAPDGQAIDAPAP